MQQVQPLPKTPIGESFYLRQISYYTFCCVRTNTSAPPVFYTWTEDEAERGCIEVGSALLDYIRSLEISPQVDTLRLFCDGCGCENKNSHVIHTLLFWLHNEAAGIKKNYTCISSPWTQFLTSRSIFWRCRKKTQKDTCF